MSTVSDVVVRTERNDDRAAVATVVQAAFEAEAPGEGVRVRDLEAALHAGLAPHDRLALVAESAGSVAGQVLLTRGWVDAPERLAQAWVLSPVSVLPGRQRQGIGRALVTAAIERARRVAAALDADDPARRVHLFLEGDPGYYTRFGFRPGEELGFTPPSVRIPPPAFQVLVLGEAPGVCGALVYPEAFWQQDCVGLR